MNLNQLYYFQQLAQTEHYREASELLHISQPSLSFAIDRLEKELEVELFQKKGRNVILTPYGQEFLIYVKKSLEELEKGQRALIEMKKNEAVEISIGVIPTVAGDLLPQLVKKYREQQVQSAKFDIYLGLTAEIIPKIKTGDYDLGICSRINDPSLQFFPIAMQEFVVLVPPTHPLASFNQLTLEELANYAFVTYRDSLPIGKTVKEFMSKSKVPLVVSEYLDDEVSIGGSVSLGGGVGLVADTPLLSQFNLIKIPLDTRGTKRLVYLALNKEVEKNQVTADFIDFLVQETREFSEK